jgi:hypothetical protein
MRFVVDRQWIGWDAHKLDKTPFNFRARLSVPILILPFAFAGTDAPKIKSAGEVPTTSPALGFVPQP